MKNKSERTTMTSFSMFFANWYSVCWFFFLIFLLYLFYSIFTCLLHLRLLCSHLFRLLYKFLLLLFCFCFVFWCHSFRLMRFCGFCSASYIYSLISLVLRYRILLSSLLWPVCPSLGLSISHFSFPRRPARFTIISIFVCFVFCCTLCCFLFFTSHARVFISWFGHSSNERGWYSHHHEQAIHIISIVWIDEHHRPCERIWSAQTTNATNLMEMTLLLTVW